MSKTPLGQCRSCNANVFWLKNSATNRTAPINADYDPKGNIVINLESGTYEVKRRALDEVLVQAPSEELHTNHFQTCPDQARWRDRQKAAAHA